MHINAISIQTDAEYKYPNQQTFKSLIKDSTVLPILNSMSKEDIVELNKIKKQLSKTKFWDLKILSNNSKEFTFQYIDKTKRHGAITNGIFPYSLSDNTINIYSIVYSDENVTGNIIETLTYKSAKRAKEVYDKFIQNMENAMLRKFHLTPIENLKIKLDELKMLEESARYHHKSKNVKFIDTQANTKDFVGNDI